MAARRTRFENPVRAVHHRIASRSGHQRRALPHFQGRGPRCALRLHDRRLRPDGLAAHEGARRNGRAHGEAALRDPIARSLGRERFRRLPRGSLHRALRGPWHRTRVPPHARSLSVRCAQWDHFGVTYEEGGKALLTAGGSRDRSNAIYREVFGKEPPAGLAHEFFNFGGKKMATSKGLGATAVEIAEIYPPEMTRFLMLRTHPGRHIEFDPAGMTLPRLVDEYDRFADAYLVDPESDMGKTWRLSQISPDPAPPGFRVRLQILADWLQIRSISPEREAEKRKGSPLTESELRDLRRRLDLARAWLDRWAPEEAKFAVRETAPEVELTPAQRRYLLAIRSLIGKVHDAEEMQNELYECAKKCGFLTAEGKVSRDAFSAIYLAFIGRPNGPRAGMLLTSLEPAFVLRRLDEMGRE